MKGQAERHKQSKFCLGGKTSSELKKKKELWFEKRRGSSTPGVVFGRLPSGIYSYICQRHLDPHLGQFVDQDCGS